jgi:membrane associated rhomboid family serine protease
MSSYETQRTSYYRPAFFGGFGLFPPVIKGLLASNVALWFLFGFLLPPFTYHGVPVFALFTEYLALWPLGTHFFPWQLLTYMFLHGGFWHLFLNMLVLWMFGVELEYTWGSRKFLIYYLLCGLGGGVVNLLVAPLLGQSAPTVGASGAIFGVLIAFGMLFPNRPVYLYLLLPVRAKFFVLGYIALELFYGVTGTTDGVAHFAHLGGAAAGALFLLVDRDTIPLRRWFWTLRGRSGFATMNEQRLFRMDGGIRDANFYDLHTDHRPSPPPRGEITQEMVDAILDKIGTTGYHSLTEEEQRILHEASKRMH